MIFFVLVQRIKLKHAIPASSHVPMETASPSQWSVMATMTAGTTVTRLLNCSVVRQHFHICVLQCEGNTGNPVIFCDLLEAKINLHFSFFLNSYPMSHLNFASLLSCVLSQSLQLSVCSCKFFQYHIVYLSHPLFISCRPTYLQFQPVYLPNLAPWSSALCALKLCV